MNVFEKIYCRAVQTVFHVALPVLPYREPRMLGGVSEIAHVLEEKGIDARIINIHTIKPLDEELIRKAAKETGKIVTVEEHSVIGGLGDAVCGAVCTGDTPCRVVKMGVQDTFGHSGPGGDLITEFGLRAANIVDEVCKLCLC